MKHLKKYGFYLLLIAVASELIFPIILAAFYTNYDSFTMLISAFGENGSPTKMAFKIWAIIDGLLLLLTIPAFYERFKVTNRSLAKWLGIMLAVFSTGDCILTGIFDRSAATTIGGEIEEMIHDYASGAGFLALLIGTFILIRLYSLEMNRFMVVVLFITFLISSVFMLLFAAPKIPFLLQLPIPYRGLWQRANLFFLYLPFVLVAIQHQNVYRKNQ
ncbi:DUF998 domain-containing protein [Enterococcus sp. LJL51]|uniref:DUF998 domain-containing protein n=1 Tax=Enterococcus sp. LJL51 TaxID=3416656 RepID=UPI003CF9D828